MKTTGTIITIILILVVFYLLFVAKPERSEAPAPGFEGPTGEPFTEGPNGPPPQE